MLYINIFFGEFNLEEGVLGLMVIDLLFNVIGILNIFVEDIFIG